MPLLIPFAAVQELTPTELEPFKDTLLAHLRKRGDQVRQRVDSHLHVTRGERVPGYRFTLEVLLETRTGQLERVTKPLTPELVAATPSGPPAAPPKGPPDVWSYPSEDRPDFKPHAEAYFIPGSFQAEDCRECYQRGEMGCKTCFGKGEEACPTCLGGGNQPCFYCKGLEKVHCLKCSGEGRITAGGVGGISTRCDACNGSGRFPCTHCQGGKLTCPQCQGGGKAVCHVCAGKGTTVCSACAGQKKVAIGQAFRSDFRPVKLEGHALVMTAPKEALDLAMAKTVPVGTLTLPAGEPFEKQVAAAVFPPSIKAAFVEFSERLKLKMPPGARGVKYRLDVEEGGVVRVSGYCAGQEFSYWMQPGDPTVVAEKDPILSLGDNVAMAAEEAQRAGDWRRAIDLAKETLSYSPENSSARFIISEWRSKVLRETLFTAGGGALLMAVANAVWIWGMDKGLHKAGAIFQMSGMQIAAGAAVGLILLFPLMKLYRAQIRWAVLLGGVLLGLLSTVGAARWVFAWNPIRAADQKALDRELHDRFKSGVPVMFYEQDLTFLNALNEKFQNSQADLTALRAAIDLESTLRAKRDREQTDFDALVARVLGEKRPAAVRRAELEKSMDVARLGGLDLSRAEEGLVRLRDEENREGLERNARKKKIQIISEKTTRRATAFSTKKSASKTKPRAKTAPKKAPSKTRSKPASDPAVWW